jgi:histidinol-phosphate aminotransferase
MKILAPSIARYLQAKRGYPFAREYDIRQPGIINLASNENPYGPSPGALAAIRREAKLVERYPDPSYTTVRKAIAKFLRINRRCIILGNGSDELMELICKAFVAEGDRVLIPIPSFAFYEIVCEISGGIPRFFQLPDFEWDGLLEATDGVKLAFIGRPNNPTGTGPPIEMLEELARRVKLLVVDEAYVEFSGSNALPLIRRRRNVILLRTFSKAFGLAGLRIGYAVGYPKVVGILNRLRAPFNINRLAQAAVIAALEDREYVRGVVQRTVKQRKWLTLRLKNLGLKVLPSDANFLMVDLSPWELSAPELCTILERKGILIRDLSGFRGAGESFVRITVGKPWQNRRLVEVLEELREALA